MVIVPSIIVLGAGLDDCAKLVATMSERHGGLIAVAEEIGTTRPEGMALMARIASLHWYQVGLPQWKARAGQLRAISVGVKMGRRPISASIIESVRIALAQDHGVRRYDDGRQ